LPLHDASSVSAVESGEILHNLVATYKQGIMPNTRFAHYLVSSASAI